MNCTDIFRPTWAFPGHEQHTMAHNSPALAPDKANSQAHLLALPIEIRMMIWEHLLPDPKVLLAKIWAMGTEDLENGITNRIQFYLEDYLGRSKFQVPLLYNICQDSRAFLSDFGGFAFGKAGDRGIWWNPKADMLVIDSTWDDEDFVTLFDGMSGLQLIKHIALDTTQAGDLAYRVTYVTEEIDRPRIQRKPLSIDLTFRSHFRGGKPSDHFIPRLFTGVEHIMLYFPELNDPGCCCGSASGHSYSAEAGCRAHPAKLISEREITRKVDIRLKLQGEAGMAVAAWTMERCRHLWMDIYDLELYSSTSFHGGGKFYISHDWARQQGYELGDEMPFGVIRYLITCEEMMEDHFTAL